MDIKKRKGSAARLGENYKAFASGSKYHNILSTFSTIPQKQKPNNYVSINEIYIYP